MLIATIGGILLVAIPVYLFWKIRKQNEWAAARENEFNIISEFRNSAVAVKVDFDHCKFRNSSYHTEVEQNYSNEALAASLLYSSFHHRHTGVKTKEVVKSVLYYLDPETNNTLVQEFPLDETMLKLHVIKGEVTLNKDPFDDKKYYFEIGDSN